MADDALILPRSGVVLTPRPFAREEEVTLHAMPMGMSVGDMIAFLEGQGSVDPALRPWLRVTIGDEAVPREFWSHRRPLADETIVVEVAPMAGSNAVRTLMQIAVIALSVWAPGAMGLTGLWAAGATAAINVGGMMAVNAIAPIKQPELSARQQRYSLDGGSNAARPHEAIPIVLGRRRIFPARCANWFTVTVDNVVYLRQMLQPCVSWVDHESPRIGQASLDSYDGVTVRWATRPDEAIEPIWFNRTPAEDSLGVPIKASSGWVTKPAPLEADALSLDVAFLAGLFESKESSGNPKNRSVTFEFRYGPRDGDPNAATACPFAPGGLLTFTRDKLDAYRVGHEWAVTRGEYDVHIRRITNEEPNNPRISDELTWVCLRAFRNEAAVRDAATVPWIELELRASDQLNGVPNDFNFIATSIVPEATAEGPGDLIVTRNPADLFLAASYAPLSDVELDDDERAFGAIAAWRATCVAEGWTCDLAEESEIGVGELLQRTAAAGRARPTLDYGALSVVVDWEKPFPRQMFTPRNVASFQGEVVVPKPIHALRVRFPNADKDYDDDTITVFAQRVDGETFYDLDTATIYEALEIRDKTDPDQVEWEAARILAERVLRPERFTFEQDVEHLTAAEGSRAWLAHHIALVGEISGRVEARVVDPEDATHKGLRLDEVVVMEAGRSYDLVWRPSADAALQVFTLETVPGPSDIVWFTFPAPALASQPVPGDLCSVYEHAVELLDVIVDRIAPKDGLKATITCVPYAEALQHVGEGGPIPAYRTGASRPPTLPGAITNRRTERGLEQLVDTIGAGLTAAGSALDGLATGTGLFAGRTAASVVSDLLAVGKTGADQAAALMKLALDAAVAQAAIEGKTYLPDGQPVGPVAYEQKIITAGLVQFSTLLGIINEDESAVLLNQLTVQVSPGQSLASFLTYVSSTLGDGTVTVSMLLEAVNGQAGRIALAVNNDEQVVGLDLGVDGETAYFDMVSPNFRFIDPTGLGPPTGVATYSGGKWVFNATLYAQKVVADSIETANLKVGAVTMEKLLAGAASGKVSAYTTTRLNSVADGTAVMAGYYEPETDRGVEVRYNATWHYPSTRTTLRLGLYRDGSYVTGSGRQCSFDGQDEDIMSISFQDEFADEGVNHLYEVVKLAGTGCDQIEASIIIEELRR